MTRNRYNDRDVAGPAGGEVQSIDNARRTLDANGGPPTDTTPRAKVGLGEQIYRPKTVRVPAHPEGSVRADPVYQAGWEAHMRGAKQTQCPHTEPRLARVWTQGWYDAKGERLGEGA